MSESFVYGLVLVFTMGVLVVVGLLSLRRMRSGEDYYIGGEASGRG